MKVVSGPSTSHNSSVWSPVVADARLANKTQKLKIRCYSGSGAALVQNVKRADAIFKAFPVLEA